LTRKATAPAFIALPNVIVKISGDKNDGNAMPVGDETVLQVNAAHAGHPHIGDETRCIVQLPGLKKVLCRTKRENAVPQRSQKFF